MKNKRNYEPFRGANCEKGIEGKKIMVVGFSIYGGKDEDRKADALPIRVNMYRDDNVPFDYWMNTYTKFIRAIKGDYIRRGGSSDTWDLLLFYNYIQEPLNGTRIPPTAQQLNDAIKPFEEMVKEFKPDIILPWGKTLYNAIPKDFPSITGKEGEPIDGNETWQYELDGKIIRMLKMTHPSAGYSWKYWHEIINKLLK